MKDPYCVTATLKAILDNHGLTTRKSGDYVVVLNSPGLVMRADIYPKGASEGPQTMQLDVTVNSDILGSRRLIESCAGFGDSEEAAVEHAWDKFCQASLHVFIAAFVGEECCKDQVSWETWSHGDLTWRVCFGPLLVVNVDPKGIGFNRLLDSLKGRLTPTMTQGAHWLRVYYFQAGVETIPEALLDNDPWPEGVDLVRKWTWPSADGWYSLRNFLLLLPNEPAAAIPQPSYLWHGIRALADNPYLDDGAVVELLVSWGVPDFHAQLLDALLPVAFGRVLLRHLGQVTVSDEFGMEGLDGRLYLAPLSAAPYFNEAHAIAEGQVLSNDDFKAIALRSSEMNGATQVLNAGKELDGCVMSPPVFLGIPKEELDSFAKTTGTQIPFRPDNKNVSEALRDRHAATKREPAPSPQSPRKPPWWKFWSN